MTSPPPPPPPPPITLSLALVLLVYPSEPLPKGEQRTGWTVCCTQQRVNSMRHSRLPCLSLPPLLAGPAPAPHTSQVIMGGGEPKRCTTPPAGAAAACNRMPSLCRRRVRLGSARLLPAEHAFARHDAVMVLQETHRSLPRLACARWRRTRSWPVRGGAVLQWVLHCRAWWLSAICLVGFAVPLQAVRPPAFGNCN